jgi:hypothetical protein
VKTREFGRLVLDNWVVWEKEGEGNREMLRDVLNLGRNVEA